MRSAISRLAPIRHPSGARKRRARARRQIRLRPPPAMPLFLGRTFLTGSPRRILDQSMSDAIDDNEHQKKPVPTRFSLESCIERTRIAAKIQSSKKGDSAMKKG
jgi:hypothetical protein